MLKLGDADFDPEGLALFVCDGDAEAVCDGLALAVLDGLADLLKLGEALFV